MPTGLTSSSTFRASNATTWCRGAADLDRRAKTGVALALGGLAAVLAGALSYLPLGLDWWEAVVIVAGVVYVLMLVETVLNDASFGD